MRIKPVMRICATVVLAAASLSLFGQGASAAKGGNGGAVSDGEMNLRGVSDPMASDTMTLLRCTSSDGSSACTADQVADLNRGIVSSRRQRKPLSMVQYLDLEPNGWLKCSQMDGSACTDEQLSAVISVASEVQSRGASLRLSRQVDIAAR